MRQNCSQTEACQVYIVWSDGYRTPRFQTRTYKICLCFQLGYLAIYIIFLCGKSSRIAEDGTCLLGYKKYAYVSLAALRSEPAESVLYIQTNIPHGIRLTPEHLLHSHVLLAVVQVQAHEPYFEGGGEEDADVGSPL